MLNVGRGAFWLILKRRNKAVFLDRDGTIIVGVDYLSSPDQIRLNLNSAEGIKKFNEMGYLVIIITNQSGVGRGYFDEERLKEINDELIKQLQDKGSVIDGLYYCPHLPESLLGDGDKACECRKPKPFMILEASRKFDIDLEQSLMVGDTPGDILAGKNAGCQTALVFKGEEYYDYKRDPEHLHPDYVVKDLMDVVCLLPL